MTSVNAYFANRDRNSSLDPNQLATLQRTGGTESLISENYGGYQMFGGTSSQQLNYASQPSSYQVKEEVNHQGFPRLQLPKSNMRESNDIFGGAFNQDDFNAFDYKYHT